MYIQEMTWGKSWDLEAPGKSAFSAFHYLAAEKKIPPKLPRHAS